MFFFLVLQLVDQSSTSFSLLSIPTLFLISDIIFFILPWLLLIFPMSLFYVGIVCCRLLVASIEFLVALTELLELPYNHYFELSVCLLRSTSFSTVSGDSSFPFSWGLFLCLLNLGESSCLFLLLKSICFYSLSLWYEFLC